MKKLNFGAISAGLDNLQSTMEQNHGIGWSELVDANAIDFAEKNTYAADDTDETIRELAGNGATGPSPLTCTGRRFPARCLRASARTKPS